MNRYQCRFSACVMVTVMACAAGALFCVVGCETLTTTTLEERVAAYYDARQFLAVGKTTMDQVRHKYGEPVRRQVLEDGNCYWLYRKTEVIAVSSYRHTPLSMERGVMAGPGRYQYTVNRTTSMELFFAPDGPLLHYRIHSGPM